MVHFKSSAIIALLLIASLTTPGVHSVAGEGMSGGLRKARDASEISPAFYNDMTQEELEEVDPDYWLPQIADVGLKCIDNSIRAGGGKPLYWCIQDGEALCIDYDHHPFGGRWTFGIKDREIKLWDPKSKEVWRWCTEASRICIGEEHGYKKGRHSVERPYMIFYDDKTHRTVGNLTCDGTDGKDDKNIGQSSILKLVDNKEIGKTAKYPVSIVKFRKGITEDPNDDNSLWNITFNPKTDYWVNTEPTPGMWNYNKHKCEWKDECPSNEPSQAPSSNPSSSDSPSATPSGIPSESPSTSPSSLPSSQPSSDPSSGPSAAPSSLPSSASSREPSSQPSLYPSSEPSGSPSDIPSKNPSLSPAPSIISVTPRPSVSSAPSGMPSALPSDNPSKEPSRSPSGMSSVIPSHPPSAIPSDSPSEEPSNLPSLSPSAIPSDSPSSEPSQLPSTSPSLIPSLSCPPDDCQLIDLNFTDNIGKQKMGTCTANIEPFPLCGANKTWPTFVGDVDINSTDCSVIYKFNITSASRQAISHVTGVWEPDCCLESFFRDDGLAWDSDEAPKVDPPTCTKGAKIENSEHEDGETKTYTMVFDKSNITDEAAEGKIAIVIKGGGEEKCVQYITGPACISP